MQQKVLTSRATVHHKEQPQLLWGHIASSCLLLHGVTGYEPLVEQLLMWLPGRFTFNWQQFGYKTHTKSWSDKRLWYLVTPWKATIISHCQRKPPPAEERRFSWEDGASPYPTVTHWNGTSREGKKMFFYDTFHSGKKRTICQGNLLSLKTAIFFFKANPLFFFFFF